MLQNLMASAPQQKKLGGRLVSSVISLTIHTGLIFAAVLGTMHSDAVVDRSAINAELTFFVQPPEEDASPPKSLDRPPPIVRHTLVAPVHVPTGIPPADLSQTFDLDDFTTFDGVESAWVGVDEESAVDTVQVFSSVTVDETPVRISSPPLEYPRMMRQAGINGVVLVQAIVDTTGRVEPGSIQVIQSSQAAFEGAATRLVQRSLFQPGRLRGQVVRVLIQIPVVFELVGNNRLQV
jgi:TonB family protein